MHDTYDVVIVGLGPVGAMLAGLLGGKGRRILVVERDTQVYPMPRAVHVDHEVIRLLSLVRADDAVMKTANVTVSYDFEAADGELLMGFRPPDAPAPTGFPWSVLFHQPTLEVALRENLARHPNIEVRLGTEFVSYDDSIEGKVSVVLQGKHAGTVTAAYIVGCDGGRSPVRRQAGIALDDLDFNEPWAVVDTLLPEGWEVLHEASRQICDPARPVTSIPTGHGRHRWEFMLLPGETADDILAPDTLSALIAAQLPPSLTRDDIEIERSAVYTFHGVFARTWRKGRVLLAGDAAHQMPPFMGQGLCSGVRDAANLAWKLDAVLQDTAPEALLDTVQPEREPQIRFITETAIGMGRVVCTQDVEAAKVRDADMCATPLAQRTGTTPGLPPQSTGIMAEDARAGVAGFPFARDVQLDLLSGYAPVLLLAQPPNHQHAAQWQTQVPGLLIASLSGSEAIKDTNGHIRQQMGKAEAILVRPDRIVFGVGNPARLVGEFADYMSCTRSQSV